MKHALLIAAFLGSMLSAYGQGSASRPYEAGLEAGSYVPLWNLARTKLRGPSGLFFRYAPQRMGLRAGIGFSQRVTETGRNCSDCPVGETTARALTLRAGGQYAPVQQLPWLYAFAEGAYRRLLASGDYTGGLCGCLDYTKTDTGRGWGAQAGLGATLALLPRLSVVPEVYYEGFITRTSVEYVDRWSSNRSRWASREKTHTPALRLLATVSF